MRQGAEEQAVCPHPEIPRLGCPSDFRITGGKHGQTWAGAPCVGRALEFARGG